MTPLPRRCRAVLLPGLTICTISLLQPGPADPLHDVRWLAGCWQQRTGDSRTDEHWMLPAGGLMVGMSRTVSGGRLRGWESLRIASDSGRLVYVAQPQGGAPTRFTATQVSDTTVVFENPAHDFPQRIAYRRLGRDSLVARVSATAHGRERGMDVPMGRVACMP